MSIVDVVRQGVFMVDGSHEIFSVSGLVKVCALWCVWCMFSVVVACEGEV
jgi:hypothetical protein